MLTVVPKPEASNPDTYSCIGLQIVLPNFVRSERPHHIFVSNKRLLNRGAIREKYTKGSHMHIWIGSKFYEQDGKILHFYEEVFTIRSEEDIYQL